MTDLSIIIVSWNTRDLLCACLQSCCEYLAGVNAEIIVVDNASDDGSADAVAEAFPGVRLVRNQKNVGFAAANNIAMQIANGRLFLLLNPDTLIVSDVFRNALDYMETHPGTGALGCRVLNDDGSTQLTCFRFPGLGYLTLQALGAQHMPWPAILGWHRMRNWNRDTARAVEVVTGCFLLIRRTAAEQVGLFDEQFFFYGEETDWCVRLAMHGWDVRFAPVGEIIHYGGASAMQLREGRMLAMTDAIVRLHVKHRSIRSARAAWLLCLSFNMIRCVGSALLSVIGGREHHHRRALDCWRAIRGFRKLWPGAHLHQESHETLLGSAQTRQAIGDAVRSKAA